MTDQKPVEFQDGVRTAIGDKRKLCCPECGGVWLHQAKVEVFNRHEDAPDGVYTEVEGESVNVERSTLEGNPSRRRSGIKIHFWCEQCNLPSEGGVEDTVGALCISQHKGNEFMYWE